MLTITASNEWHQAHPGAAIGLLEISGVDNTAPAARLEAEKQALQARLRIKYDGFARADFLALPVMAAYARYYRRFKKTYHVLLQVESIALKGRDLPRVSPLVDANFCAELETLILTAGHDAAPLREPLVIDAAGAGEYINLPGGGLKELLVGDMLMRDAHGVRCSIIYGQDQHSLITPRTSHALYVTYAPAGVPAESVMGQLESIEYNIRLFCSSPEVRQRRLLSA